jgi:hypothetical protein
MRRYAGAGGLSAAMLIVVVQACDSPASPAADAGMVEQSLSPEASLIHIPFDPSSFVAHIDNPYLPQTLGTVYRLRSETPDGVEINDITITRDTKVILGVAATPYQEWVGSDTNRYPPREWGSWWRPVPWVGVSNDLGLFVGAGFVRTSYRFRRAPFASEIRARFGYSTGAQTDVEGELHPENASHFWRLHLRASGIEVLHYYGEGNDAPNIADNDFYRVQQARYIVEPAFVVPLGLHSEVSVGIKGQWSHTGDNEGRFIATIQDTLLGGRDFGQVGGRVAFDADTRDRPVNPLRGVHLSAAAEIDPAVWDVSSTFGGGEVRVETFASARLPGTPTLALRAGGRKVWGSFPFFESAFLGGVSTLPGYHSNRFAGDASLYGGAQLRLTVGRAFLALPAVWGLYGDVGTGRVYVDEDSPGGWHGGAGGGAWLAFLDRRNALSIGFASSEEGTIVLAGAAFGL